MSNNNPHLIFGFLFVLINGLINDKGADFCLHFQETFSIGPHNVGSDSLITDTVLSLPVVTFQMLGSMCYVGEDF